ncbi:hypothetical protein PAXRUDRAFT_181696, partial [Paxillus rubicundulus Ve08.2h10]
ALYPNLSHMALDYLSIPATSVDVKQLFSWGCLVLSHVWSHLFAQLTHALLCLGTWSLLGFVEDNDVLNVSLLPNVVGDKVEKLKDGRDSINP